MPYTAILLNTFTNKGKFMERNIGKRTLVFLHIGKTAGTQIEHISNKLISYGVDIKKAGHDLKLKSIKGELPYFSQYVTQPNASSLAFILESVKASLACMWNGLNSKPSHSMNSNTQMTSQKRCCKTIKRA